MIAFTVGRGEEMKMRMGGKGREVSNKEEKKLVNEE
jgi:hypothetical protein